MLEAQHITFGYDVARPLFDDFSMAIEAGERVALVAPSGFGKTTLCRLLAGYITPTSGNILMDGKPLPQCGPVPVQLISQHPERALDPHQSMERALDEAGDASEALLDALSIQRAWFTRYPHELSGGELQRFCIARALITNPRYLVADEITTMLDAVSQAEIWATLLAWANKHTMGIVFVSHSKALVRRLATRTIKLADEA